MSSNKYMCMQVSHKASAPPRGEEMTPTQMQAMYAKFNDWREKFADSIVDIGGQLGAGKLVTSDGDVDGPSVEAKEVIGGYMILSADSLEQAIEVARACPGVVRPGSSIDVRLIRTP